MKHSQKYDILSRVARRHHHNTQALGVLLIISTGDTSIQPPVRITARNRPVTSGTQRFIRISETGIVHSKPRLAQGSVNSRCRVLTFPTTDKKPPFLTFIYPCIANIFSEYN